MNAQTIVNDLISKPTIVTANGPVKLGGGYDIFSCSLRGAPFNISLPITDDVKVTSEIDSHVSQIEETMRSKTSRTMSLNVAGKYGSFKASMQFSIMEDMFANTESFVFYFYYDRTFSSQSIDLSKIPTFIKNDLASKFRKSPKEFILNHGTHYIASIKRGFRATGTISVASSTYHERRIVAAAFNANYKALTVGANSEADSISIIEKITSGFSSEAKISLVGVSGVEPVPAVSSIDEVIKLQSKIGNMASDSLKEGVGEPVSIELRPYSELFPNEYTEVVRNEITRYAQYRDFGMKIEVIGKSLIEINSNPTGFQAISKSDLEKLTQEWVAVRGQLQLAKSDSHFDLDGLLMVIELLYARLPRPQRVVRVSCMLDSWTPVGLRIPANLPIKISVPENARWGFSVGGNTCPLSGSNIPGQPGCLKRDAPIGALIGKCGEDIRYIGLQEEISFDKGGALYLAQNDGPHDDNSTGNISTEIIPITVGINLPLPW